MTNAMPSDSVRLPTLEVDGGLWFSVNESLHMNDWRIDLLEQIDANGSITQAAKNVGFS